MSISWPGSAIKLGFSGRRREVQFGQFGNRHGPESIGERKAVRCAADNGPAGDAGFADSAADELQVDRFAGAGQLSTFRFEQFQAASGVGDEVYLACAVAPEEQAASAPGAAFAVA